MARVVLPQRGPMLKWIVNTLSNRFLCGLLIGWVGSSIGLAQAPAAKPIRQVIASAAAAATPAEQREIVLTLKLAPSAEAVTWFEKWKTGEIFLNEDAAGVVTHVTLTGTADADDSFATVRVSDGTPLLTPDGKAIRINPNAVEYAETDSGLRRAMKEASDLVALAAPDLTMRLRDGRSSRCCSLPNRQLRPVDGPTLYC